MVSPPLSLSSMNKDELNEAARDMNFNWVNEEHMKVFEQALSDEPDDQFENGSRSPLESHTPTTNQRVSRLISLSDFAPIKERIRLPGTSSNNRGGKKRSDIVREGWTYHASRWPLLALIFSIIATEFFTYLIVRQFVNIIEYISSWRGYRGKLRVALRNATTYEEWKERAIALDNYLKLDSWKRSPQNAYYDSPLIKRVLKSLRELRSKNDIEGVIAVLEVALRSNFAGVESFRLYSETFYGTKDLVETYVDEVARSIEFVRNAPTSSISIEEKARFLRYASKNLGATALCLSGGASFDHFGVVRALLDANLLPRVITGTSAGAIIAAFLCTRTDEELKLMLTPALADKITACEEGFFTWIQRFIKTGARFSTIEWARKASFFTMGSMTFKEAYERTGRILNVSVIPYDTNSPTKLLSYVTAPDCVIYSAVIASAAVPGILNPVVLLIKRKDGSIAPWEFQGKHKDGSLRSDIPLHSLHLLYNVNFSIASQVNPHIHLFHFAARGSVGRPVSHRGGKGWRGGFLLSSAEQYLKLELTKNFRVLRDLELLPEFAGQNWSAVFLQKFEGNVTIFPKSRILDWLHLLDDPDRIELARMIKVGQSVTWPKIKMIENRMKIERQIDLGREEIQRLRSISGHLHRESSYDLPPVPVLIGIPDQKSNSSTSSNLPQIDTNLPSIDQTSDSELEETYDDEEEEEQVGDIPGMRLHDVDITPKGTPRGSPKKSRTKELFPLPSSSSSNSRHINGNVEYNTSTPSSSSSKIPTSTPTPAKRRKQILARLGLQKNSKPSNLSNNTNNEKYGDDTQDDSEDGPSGAESEIPFERQLRRRYSMGTLRLAERVQGRRGVGYLGSGGSESEAEDGFNYGGYNSSRKWE